jgi:hypothetical protein
LTKGGAVGRITVRDEVVSWAFWGVWSSSALRIDKLWSASLLKVQLLHNGIWRMQGSSLFAAVLVAAPLITVSADAEECQSVYVVGNARDVVECPADQEFDYCIIRANLVDRAGLLTGRLEFFEDFDKGSKHPQDASVNLYVAVAKITTEKGTLELLEHGIFDTKSLEFAGLATITDGTGEFAGLAGTLTEIGHSEGTVLITGTICEG